MLSGLPTAYISGDQRPKDLVPLCLNMLIESKERQPYKILEKHLGFYTTLPIFINEDPEVWSQEKFRAFWLNCIKQKVELLCVDHLSCVQGFNFLLFWLIPEVFARKSFFNFKLRKFMATLDHRRTGGRSNCRTFIASPMSGLFVTSK